MPGPVMGIAEPAIVIVNAVPASAFAGLIPVTSKKLPDVWAVLPLSLSVPSRETEKLLGLLHSYPRPALATAHDRPSRVIRAAAGSSVAAHFRVELRLTSDRLVTDEQAVDLALQVPALQFML